MNALEFLQERQRMCDTYYNPEDEKCSASCPATGIQCVDMSCIHENGCLDVCPCALSDTYRNKYGGCANYDVGCSECRKDFWGQEV